MLIFIPNYHLTAFIQSILYNTKKIKGKQHISKADFFSQSDENNSVVIELDEREKIVLSLICEGKTSDEIAKAINRSKKLVDLIRTKLVQKFEASNAIDLVRKSILMGYYVPKD